ncbi:MAG: hypothetical protein A2Z32_09800 [Chloroflexi bacterium RBG_16_69_14]|nr:MAG: hypothetical protein A2Z32_09800 [Chloroflexi bacterium RBG_16_69_14]
MSRRSPAILVLAATVAMLVAACGGGTAGPALTDPEEILTAALKSTEAAKSVHIQVAIDGEATIVLPGTGTGPGTPVDLTGTTASADLDFAKPAAKATFSVPALLNFAGEVIAIDGKSYVKTTLTGPLYQESVAYGSLDDLTDAGRVIDGLGDLLLKEGVELVKGDDVACGSEQCYTVTTDLTAEELGIGGTAATLGLPIDLKGASLKITVLVEKDLPYHLAGVTAELTMADGSSIKMDLAASKWDEPVSISAPPADKVKPSS